MPRTQSFFTKEERHIMMKHNVPYYVAYQRVKFQDVDRQEAMTKPLKYDKNKPKAQKSNEVCSPHELNWKR